MEIADIFVVNKADREGADRVVQAVAASLSLHAPAAGEWRPPIVKTEATTGAGVDTLWAEIRRFREHASERRAARRRARDERRLRDLVAHRFLQHVETSLPAGAWDGLVDRVMRRELDPYSAADAVLRAVVPSAAGAPSHAGAAVPPQAARTDRR
jgi:LAO/AO transport system kinase